MKYTIEYVVIKGEKEDIVFDFGKEHSLISIFLTGESNMLDMFLENICLVLSGKFERAEVSGDLCDAEIDKEKTKIIYQYPDEDDEDEVNEETIGTMELKQQIEEYEAKRKEFFRLKKIRAGKDSSIPN